MQEEKSEEKKMMKAIGLIVSVLLMAQAVSGAPVFRMDRPYEAQLKVIYEARVAGVNDGIGAALDAMKEQWIADGYDPKNGKHFVQFLIEMCVNDVRPVDQILADVVANYAESLAVKGVRPAVEHLVVRNPRLVMKMCDEFGVDATAFEAAVLERSSDASRAFADLRTNWQTKTVVQIRNNYLVPHFNNRRWAMRDFALTAILYKAWKANTLDAVVTQMIQAGYGLPEIAELGLEESEKVAFIGALKAKRQAVLDGA